MTLVGLELVSKTRCFGGLQKVYKHYSTELNCSMKFSLYEPEPESLSGRASSVDIEDEESRKETERFHVLFYLSGLTNNEETFIQRSGFQKYANERRLIVVGPDTWPRGSNLPGETDSWEFNEETGFYLDAVRQPWSSHYRMYSYVSQELPKLIQESFPTTGKFGICGHSMGGHGALVVGLKNQNTFSSISVLAPICNPSKTNLGQIMFKNFLGSSELEKKAWANYDSTELAKIYEGPFRHVLMDQGTADELLERLLPKNLKEAVASNTRGNIQLELRMQEGYHHPYPFIATFIQDHINHHANILSAL